MINYKKHLVETRRMDVMTGMTSKERIRAALEHKETDRVPTTMQCVGTAWENLKKYLKMDTEEEILQYFDIDTRIMDLPPYTGPQKAPYVNERGEKVYTNMLGCEYINKWNGAEYNMHIISHPYSGVKTFDDLEKFEGWINPDHYDYNAVTQFVKKHEDKAIRIGWPGPYQVFTLLYGTEEFYINMYEEPELMQAMLDRYCSAVSEIYERMFEAANGQVDILRCCDDYGTQRSMLFSISMWKEFFEKNTRMFAKLAHKHGAYYMQHSCGSVRAVIPKLIECGVDALEPIQKVTGMDVDDLKREFGDQLCFQGGIDTQYILPKGTPQEVYDETTRVIKALYKRGGYILCGSQDFEGDVPPENICALYEAAKRFES